MQMIRKDFYKVGAIVVLVAAGLVVGFLVWRQWAIQNAIEACNPGYGLQAVEPPTEFRATLTTYGKARNPTRRTDVWNPPDSGKIVWVVDMKGKWLLVGGPPPAPDNPGPFYWDECTIIIDALTGESKSTPIE